MTEKGLKKGAHYLAYNPKLKERARELRSNSTKGEIRLWCELLKNKRTGYQFYRQRIIDYYIADFYCPALKLIIEIDGSSHIGKEEYDAERTAKLEEYGLVVLRFTEGDVLENLGYVERELFSVIEKMK